MATVDFFTAYNYKWAQAGGNFAWQDDQYQLGWATIGSTPPTVEQFNRVLQISDEKSNWLYGQLLAAATAKGIALSAGDLNSLKNLLDAYTPAATESIAGIMRIATAAEAQSFLSDSIALTPKKLADAFGGSNQSQTSPGYLKLPSGIIIQWSTVLNNVSGFAPWTYPIAFPSEVWTVLSTAGTLSPDVEMTATLVGVPSVVNCTASVFVAGVQSSTPGQVSVRYFAIGR